MSDTPPVVAVYGATALGKSDVALELATVPDAGRAMGARVAIRQTTGEPVLGFFRGPSPRPGPVGAWR